MLFSISHLLLVKLIITNNFIGDIIYLFTFWLSEDDADALKYVGVFKKKTFLIYIYIYSAFVGLENKLYKMQGTYIKIIKIYSCYIYHQLFSTA